MTNALTNTLKEIISFLKSLEGLLSLVPSIAIAADTYFNFIPLISDAKPEFYLLSIIFVFLAFLWQVSKYITTKPNDSDHQAMMKKAGIHVLIFVLFVVLFFLLGPLSKYVVHLSWLAANMHLFFALWLALSVFWLTSAIVVLALRIYIGLAR